MKFIEGFLLLLSKKHGDDTTLGWCIKFDSFDNSKYLNIVFLEFHSKQQ